MCMECVWGQGLKEGRGEVEGRKEGEKENGGPEPKLKTISGSPLNSRGTQSNLWKSIISLCFTALGLYQPRVFLPQVHPMIIFPFFCLWTFHFLHSP